MKALYLGILMTSLTIGSAATAKGRSAARNAPLSKALAVVASSVAQAGQGQDSRKVDPDQGDDHANAGAILMVCRKETPAARRSAICPVSVSPE